MAELILVTGGARSGKSSLALERAEKMVGNRLFVATCPKVDPEMSERVRRHQQEREGRGWVTLEIETDLSDVFSRQNSQYEVILVDCITLWVNNIMYRHEHNTHQVDDEYIGDLCEEWLQATEHFNGTIFCVTNEVGLGIVPDNALARRYRDLVGTCNQLIAKKAKEVILVSCGIPLYLKS